MKSSKDALDAKPFCRICTASKMPLKSSCSKTLGSAEWLGINIPRIGLEYSWIYEIVNWCNLYGRVRVLWIIMNHDSSAKRKCTFQILSQHVYGRSSWSIIGCMTWRKTFELPANGELNLFGTSLQFRSDLVNSLCNKWHPQGASWWMKHRLDHGTSMHRRTLAFSGLGLMHRTKCGSETSILPISCRRETRNLQERMGPRLGIFDASMALLEVGRKWVELIWHNSTVPYKSKTQAVWHSLSSAYSNQARMYL